MRGEEVVPSTAPDGLGSDPDWMNSWTILYWGWWIAWAPFVGVFIAKISRERTVREVICASVIGTHKGIFRSHGRDVHGMPACQIAIHILVFHESTHCHHIRSCVRDDL